MFDFLKYLQPTHYFQVPNKKGDFVFPNITDLNAQEKDLLVRESAFQSEQAANYELSWQAIYKGYIGDARPYTSFEKVSVHDNYVFIRKYFHKAWVFYVLVLRLLALKNPFREIGSWWRTKYIKRYAFDREPLKYTDWESFNSDLISSQPLVSVVIPTLNRYQYLKDVLRDFEQQDYNNFEIIVVDQSDEIDRSFYDQFKLKIVLVKQEEKALWLARNNAINKAKGHYIALSEDDVRIPKNWISVHLKCLDFFKAQISAGVFFPEGKSLPRSVPPQRD